MQARSAWNDWNTRGREVFLRKNSQYKEALERLEKSKQQVQMRNEELRKIFETEKADEEYGILLHS